MGQNYHINPGLLTAGCFMREILILMVEVIINSGFVTAVPLIAELALSGRRGD